MKSSMYREDIVRLDRRLSLESQPARRQKLTRRLKQELDRLEAAEMKTITPRQAYSGSYWKARAARLRQASELYGSQAIHGHLLEVAAGYDRLAEQAHKIQRDATRTARGCERNPAADASTSVASLSLSS